MVGHVTNLNLAFAAAQPAKRSFLGRIADLVDRVIQKIVLVVFYYLPLSLTLANPFLRRSDVRRAFAGTSQFPSGRYAIYVLWQPRGDIPWYVRNMLESLRAHQVNVVAVINHEPRAEQLEILQAHCATLLVRGNKGADFGAYQDAVLSLAPDNESISRLLLLNDSAYAFPRGLDQLIAKLLSDELPVVSAYECWERLYHFQSFCIGLSGSIVRHPEFQAFWQNYRPISIRRWRINHGEVGLSSVLRKVCSRFKVVYELNDLLDTMTADQDWTSILKYREFVPRPLRHMFPHDEVVQMLQQVDPQERELLLRRLREGLSDLLMIRAQAHTGAFLFAKFRGSPLLKRDLVYREQFSLYEVERMLAELGLAEYRAEIADEIRQRGSAAHLKGLARRRYRLNLTTRAVGPADAKAHHRRHGTSGLRTRATFATHCHSGSHRPVAS
jgi:hypothetical protein